MAHPVCTYHCGNSTVIAEDFSSHLSFHITECLTEGSCFEGIEEKCKHFKALQVHYRIDVILDKIFRGYVYFRGYVCFVCNIFHVNPLLAHCRKLAREEKNGKSTTGSRPGCV